MEETQYRNTNTLSLGPDFSYFDERVYILIIMSSQKFKGYFEKEQEALEELEAKVVCIFTLSER